MNEDEVISTVDSTSDEPELSLAEFRAKLGLVESETPQQKLENKQRRKVADFLERTADQATEKQGYSYSSQVEAAQRATEFWETEKATPLSIRKGLSYLSKYRGQRALANATDRDIAKSLTDHLEQTGSPLLYQNDPRQKKLSSIDYEPLRKSDFTALIAQLEQPVATFQRMELLMGNNWESLLKFHTKEVSKIVLKIAESNEDAVQKVASTIRAHGFLSVSVYPEGGYASEDGKYHPDLDLIAQACTNGGFSETFLAQLDIIARQQRLIPRYTDVPLSRVPELASHAAAELQIAERVIRDLDQEEVREVSRFGPGRPIIKELSPTELVSLVDAVQSEEEFVFRELITSADEHDVPVGSNTYNELLSRVQRIFGPRAGGSKRLAGLAANLVNSESPNFRTPDQMHADRQREQVKRDLDGLQNPRLEFARAIAEARGMSFATDTVFQYTYLDRISQEAYQNVSPLTDDERLHFYQDLVSADKYSTQFWEKISQDITNGTLSDEHVERMKSVLLPLLTEHIFSRENTVDQSLVIRAYEEGYCQDKSLLKYLPEQQRPFFDYLVTVPIELRSVLREHREEFATLVVNGKETALLMKYLLEDVAGKTAHAQKAFVEFLSKEKFATTYGVEIVEKFLKNLPKKTDERRNAFTHNEYDRTSGLLEYFISDTSSGFDLKDDIGILSEFIKEFGLSRSPEIFRLFKLALLYETGQLQEKPAELEESGIESTAQLLKEVKELRIAVMSETGLHAEKLRSLSAFQLQLLKVIVGKTTHRFDEGRPTFEKIISDYIYSEEQGQIAPVGAGFATSRLEMGTVTIEFDATEIEADFTIIRNEVLDSISHVNESADLVAELHEVVLAKIETAKLAIEKMPEDKKSFGEKNLSELQNLAEKLSQPLSLDQLLVILLNTNLGKAEQSTENSLKRRVILRKIFERHFSGAFIQDVQINLSGETTPTAILTVLNIVDELVKQHALNLADQQTEGAAQYWSAETVTTLKSSKSGKKLYEVFGGTRDKLKAAVDEFVIKESSGKTVIDAIPARDFTAEVSGYIADVCYTKEYPLLKDRPVTPYKFVVAGETAEQGELGGSVLIFEVTNADGEQCLLVRGFDFRNEEQVNIPQFVEKFLDEMAVVAKKTGKKQVLLPGVTGAISNYPMTINHINSHYVREKQPISLNEEFRFNGYDLTNNCFVARTATE